MFVIDPLNIVHLNGSLRNLFFVFSATQLTSILFAQSGFVVCTIDHQDHGLDSLIYHIPDLTPVVDDCIHFFTRFRQSHAPGLPAFLYAESLSSAIAYTSRSKRKLATASPRRVAVRPRAATTPMILRVCGELQERFDDVDVPLLIVHGGDNVMCDLACVEELYTRASSKDKTLKIYPRM
ncbi:conserved hypothetical protein [Ricinus communis]|uniref:Serine aminopeptidase S33 domain-containing protein n=1 Tax=Ricinus communis TaxID=3988 RepID=B9SUB2_RICCO|nr:conserved hypothetical protein [Ricinus communis]